MFDHGLALLTGVDIPIPELQLLIHQPTIKEISLIGEEVFFAGIQILCIDKQAYIDNEELLKQTNNFQLFIGFMIEPQTADKKEYVIQVLELLLPEAKIVFTPRSMLINFNDQNIIIDEGNFSILQALLKEIFCISKSDADVFKPSGAKAQKIARKMLKNRQKVAQLKAKENGGSVLSKYLSIITIGVSSMRLQDCCELTLYQIYDLVERYGLYVNWDIDIRARLAGATNTKPVDDWMKNIH